MMKEIYARGPIACSGVTTVDFVKSFAQNPGVLKDGIFRDPVKYNESDIDHIMEITGWGESADGSKYWVVRNSWGTYWGVAGWFKLERGKNSLLIEEHCDWAIPDFDELDNDLLNEIQGDYYKGVPGGSLNMLVSNMSGKPSPVSKTTRNTQLTASIQGVSVDQPMTESSSSAMLVATAFIGAVVGACAMQVGQRMSRKAQQLEQPTLLG